MSPLYVGDRTDYERILGWSEVDSVDGCQRGFVPKGRADSSLPVYRLERL